jgi:hypothetical protein
MRMLDTLNLNSMFYPRTQVMDNIGSTSQAALSQRFWVNLRMES